MPNNRPFSREAGIICFLLFCCWQFLSVDISPIVTNDGVGYLNHSRNLVGTGLVNAGYRTVGYPLFLNLTSHVADLLGYDALSFIPLAQRILFFGMIITFAWSLGWWSTPFLAVFLHGDFFGLSNFVLTESVGISFSILCILSIHNHVIRINSKDVRWLVTASLALFFAYSIRSTYLSLSLFFIPVFFYHLLFRQQRYLLPIILIGVTGISCAALLLGIARENYEEFGDFSPATNNIRSYYYGVYNTTFKLDPELKQSLPELYENGDVYKFIHEMDRMDSTYSEKVTVYNARTDKLLAAASTSRMREALKTTWHFVTGPRANDLAPLQRTFSVDDPDERILAQLPNIAARREGTRAFVDSYNHGQRPALLSTSALFKSPMNYSMSSAYSWILVCGLLVCSFAAFYLRGVSRYMAFCAVFAHVAISWVYGWHLSDIWRFSLLNCVIITASGSFYLRQIGEKLGKRRQY